MPVSNTRIQDIFEEVADTLDIQGANPFRIRAYRNAARVVGGLSDDLAERVENGDDLSELPGIGKDLAAKIQEIVKTGFLSQLEKLREQTPETLTELLDVPRLGPKRVRALNKALGIKTLDDLKEAAEQGQIAKVKGFGEKTQQHVLDKIGEVERTRSRTPLGTAAPLARSLEKYLKGREGVKQLAVAGSFRRQRATVGDLDILVTCEKDKAAGVMDAFASHDDVREVISRGSTRSSVVLATGLQVDLRIVAESSFGAALHYFTGSKSHNIAVRRRGIKRGYKINEYGVHRVKDDKKIAGKTEQEVYKAVDLPYIPPELREDSGEIEAAEKGELPDLITEDDIRGDLHAHTKRTDGHDTIEDMARAARDLGHEYLAITEHSRRVSMAKGLDDKALRKHIQALRKASGSMDGITILAGIEVDILKDGSLDLSDEVLADLDVVVASVHYDRDLSRDRQTKRVLTAMDNPRVHILGHPTGRRLGESQALDLDMDAIVQGAAERGVILELDGNPDRLDLPPRFCRAAAEAGGRIAISTDAHSTDNLRFMPYGVGQARRGWLTADDVVNTRDLEGLKKLLTR